MFLSIHPKTCQLYEAFLKVILTVCDTVRQLFHVFNFYEAFSKVGVTNCDTVERDFEKFHFYEGVLSI